jgi:hypothetical protein
MAEHKRFFTADGKRVPGVTTVIGGLGWNKNVLMAWQRKMFLQGIDPQTVSQEALYVGSLVHDKILAYLAGGPTPSLAEWSNSVQSQAESAFNAYLAWEKQHDFHLLFAETPFISEKWKFGARIDMVAMIDSRPTVADFKVAKGIYVDHRLQVAAERVLYQEHTGEYPDGLILRLGKEDGAFEPRPLRHQESEWALFQHLLAIHQLRPLVDD